MKHHLTTLFLLAAALTAKAQLPNAADYDSLQAALDAHPGQIVFVPQGRHEISEALRLTTDNSGLVGHGVIVANKQYA